MGAGEYPLLRALRKASLSLDGAVSLGIGFVEHHRGKVLPFEVPQPPGLGGKLLQHAGQLAGVQGRQAGFQGIGAGFIVELGKERQLMLTDLDDAVTMAIEAPLYLYSAIRLLNFFLDARYCPMAIVTERIVHGLRHKQVRDVVETGLSLR